MSDANRTGRERNAAGILARLDSSAEFWEQRLKKMLARSRLLGSYVATDLQRLWELAPQRGVHHLDNLVAVPAATG